MKLEKIWEDQKEFNDKVIKSNLGIEGIKHISGQQKQEYMNFYTLAAIKELTEVLDETDWKKHRNEGGTNKRSNMLEELVDVFKYWMCITQLYGFTWDDIENEYWRKSSVVEQRFHQEKILEYDGKIAGVDIDGVLAGYPESFIDFVNREKGTSYTTDQIKSYAIYDDMGLTREEGEALKHKYRETGQKRYMKVLKGAREFLQYLKDKGYTVVLLTSRPYEKYKRIFADTQIWLKNNGLVFDAILYDENKGTRLMEEFGKDKVEFFVDDVAGFANDVADAGVPCFLINKPYNEGVKLHDDVTRVENLKEVIEKLEGE